VSEKIQSIHYLRGVAALFVVVAHAGTEMLRHIPIGKYGVIIFFVISGFIMYVVARNQPPLRFIASRAIRIVPVYWIVLAVAWLKLTVAPEILLATDPAVIEHWIKSMFFIPDHSPILVRHQILPLVVTGWTLFYEVVFYLIFAAAIIWKRPIFAPLFIIAAMQFLANAYYSSTPLDKQLTSPYWYYFIGGLIIGWAYTEGYISRIPLPIGLMATVVLLPLLLTTKSAAFLQLPYEQALRIVIVTAFVAGVVAIEPIAARYQSKAFDALGNASYSIYLTHLVFSPHLTRSIMANFSMLNECRDVIKLCVFTGISLAVGIAFYALIERPLIRWLKGISFGKTPLRSFQAP